MNRVYFLERHCDYNNCNEVLRTTFFIFFYKYYFFKLIKLKAYLTETHFCWDGAYNERVSFENEEDAINHLKETIRYRKIEVSKQINCN